MTEKERQAEQARRNQRAHRAAEAAALLLLTRARSDATKTDGSLLDVASTMRSSLRDAIVVARSGAKQRGLARLSGELESLGVDVDLPAIRTVGFTTDWLRADRLSRSYADRWLRKAEAAESKAKAAASVETQGSLERIAVTESSEAFTAARADVAELLEQREMGVSPPLRLISETRIMRAWDATLDRRTCPVCSGADGTIVGLNEAFPAGEPGSVHAWCRCLFSLVRVNFRG